MADWVPTERRLGMAEQSNNERLQKANIASIQATAIRQLVDGGFSHKTAVAAVHSGDMSVLAKAVREA